MEKGRILEQIGLASPCQYTFSYNALFFLVISIFYKRSVMFWSHEV